MPGVIDIFPEKGEEVQVEGDNLICLLFKVHLWLPFELCPVLKQNYSLESPSALRFCYLMVLNSSTFITRVEKHYLKFFNLADFRAGL